MIPSSLTPGGHRRYDVAEVARALGVEADQAAARQPRITDEIEFDLHGTVGPLGIIDSDDLVIADVRPVSSTVGASVEDWKLWTSGDADG